MPSGMGTTSLDDVFLLWDGKKQENIHTCGKVTVLSLVRTI